jgi:hypothetical protein
MHSLLTRAWSRRVLVTGLITALFLQGLWITRVTPARAAGFQPISKGDIVAALLNGQVNEYTPYGTLVQNLIPQASTPAGSAFDGSGNLYVTEFSANDILKVNGQTGAVSVFSNNSILADGTSFNSPESIAFGPGYSTIYVSDANRNGPGGGIHVLDPATGKGTGFFPLPSSTGSDGVGESDWLAFSPSADLYMTNENAAQGIMKVDPSTKDIVQPSFKPNLPNIGYAMSFDPSGDLWLSATNQILEYAPDGMLLRTITNGAFNTVFSAVFNPPFNTIYAGDLSTGTVFTYDLLGTLIRTFSLGSGVAGLSVAGTVVVPNEVAAVSLQPQSAASPIGTPVTLTATATNASGSPVSGASMDFTLNAGPDAQAGQQFKSVTTNDAGQATFVLPGLSAGTDVAVASVGTTTGTVSSSSALVKFVAQPGDLTGTANQLTNHAGDEFRGHTLATFTDPKDNGSAAATTDFSARVDWHDSSFYSSTATVVGTGQAPGTFKVDQSFAHVFCSPGTYKYTITVLDRTDKESFVLNGGSVTVTATSRSHDKCTFGRLLFSTAGNTRDALNGGVDSCSGTMVNSPSGLMVITAAHCLRLNSDGTIADQIAGFIPAVQEPLGNDEPFGVWTSTQIYMDPLYSQGNNTNADAAYDYAYVKLDPNSCFLGTDIGATGTGQCPIPDGKLAPHLGGGMNIEWSPPRGNGWLVFDPGANPSTCSPTFSNNDSLGSGPDLMVERCNMTDNPSTEVPVSGSAWIDTSNDELAAVTSKAGFFRYLPNIFDNDPSLWGTYLSDQARSDLNAFDS